MNPRSWVVRVLLPLLVLAGGVALMVGLIASRPEATRKPATHVAPLVEVVTAESMAGERVTVTAMGTVRAAKVLDVFPEVAGRVVFQHAELEQGGLVRAGDVLVRLDDRSYALAVREQRAQVARARVEIEVEQGRETIAKREWESVHQGEDMPPATPSGRALALREPQRRAARAAVSAARSGVSRARLELERTQIEAPFDAFVQQENVEIGQRVGPQSLVARLVGTDYFWVEANVPMAHLAWIPRDKTGRIRGAGVRITQHIAGGQAIVRRGKVTRLLEDLDPLGRMARLLVEVPDPLALADGASRELPLLLGAYVNVAIEGRPLDRAVSVPRAALREDGHVWVVDDSSQLRIAAVTVVWNERDRVLVSDGLEPGSRIVVSPLAAVEDGMLVRVAETDQARLSPEGAP